MHYIRLIHRFRKPYTSFYNTMASALETVENVEIDTGRFKYVLIKVYPADNEAEFKHIVRGCASAEYHADIYDPLSCKLSKQGLETECIGGGRIIHHPDEKSINVFGYSQGYGKADHALTCKIIKTKYPEYTDIKWSDEGY